MTTRTTITEGQCNSANDEMHRTNAVVAAGRGVHPCLQSYIAEAMDHLYVENTNILLEIPCHIGCNTVMLARSVPLLVAMDASAEALQRAKKRITQQTLPGRYRENIAFQRGSVYDTGFPDASFDGGFCWDLLSYLQYPQCALKEMLRICKPGHRIVGNLLSVAEVQTGSRSAALPPGGVEVPTEPFNAHCFTEEEALLMLGQQPDCNLVKLYTVQWPVLLEEEEPEGDVGHVAWIFVLEKES